MASFNKIIIVGYLGRDPELRYTPQGMAVCNFSVATTEKKKNNLGESEDQTTWFRVTAWSKTAEVVNQYLAKGAQVYIEGRVRLNTYTDRDGGERTNLEVNATDVHFLSRKSEGQSNQESGRESRSARDQVDTGHDSFGDYDEGPAPIDKDDIPF